MVGNIKGIVSKEFHKWLKVFGKMKSEIMLTRKLWNHAINIREGVMIAQSTTSCFIRVFFILNMC